MSVHFARGGCAALIFAFSTQGALAELTAKDVWSDWQAYAASMGYDITGTESMSGNTLTINNVGTTVDLPEEAGTVSVLIPEISLIENGDGTVNITLPATQVLTIAVDPEDEEDVDIGVTYSHTGLMMQVSGDPTDMRYVYTADNVTASLASIAIDGETMPADVATVSVAVDAITGNSQMTIGELRSYKENMKAGGLSLEIKAKNPDGDEMFEMSGRSQNLESNSSFTAPLKIDTSDMRAMLESGFDFAGVFSYGAGGYDLKGEGDGDQFSAKGSSDGGTFEFSLDGTNMLYDFVARKVAMAVTTNELPFPVSFDFAEYAFLLNMPTAKTTQLQDFALGLSLKDFNMADMLWGIFDPTGALPRDPASIDLDVNGQAKVLVDMFDQNIEEVLENLTAPPAELHALTLNNLLVSAVGAELTGTGAFTFDNNDLETYGGMPAPAGSVALKLVGANGLLDKLVAMGLIGDNEVMGARMGMGMLAVAGDGEDTLLSDIEVTADGQITANGQRIK